MKTYQVKLVILLYAFSFSAVISDKQCIPRSFGLDSTVCVCNATYCDTISETVPPPRSKECLIITSNKAGLRFRRDVGTFVDLPDDPGKEITVSPNKTYQTIIGFGGAFTDAAGININSLSDGAKENLLRSYFSNKEGIGYNLARIPMGGTDFSTHGYSYDDGKEDKELKNFNLTREDYEYKIPLIKEALKLSSGNMQLLTSTWTAPKWMKTNHEYNGYGFLKRSMYQVWANYFLKFLQSYKEEGLEFWGITTGNEPSLIYHPNIKVNTVGWHTNAMRNWIADYLGPTLRSSEFRKIKILALDDMRNYLPRVPDTLFESNKVRNYVDGIAVHWYVDKEFSPNLLTKTHEHFPDKFILNTEASIVPPRCPNCLNNRKRNLGGSKEPVSLGSWKNAERYAHDIIQDLQHWVTGWVDWNIALDMAGGPTYVNNTIDSSIIVNAAKEEFYKQPMFYAIGHFSKFLPRGSIRIGISNYDGDLRIVAFQRPDYGIVITILNLRDDNDYIVIKDTTRGSYNMSVSPKSLNTIVYW